MYMHKEYIYMYMHVESIQNHKPSHTKTKKENQPLWKLDREKGKALRMHYVQHIIHTEAHTRHTHTRVCTHAHTHTEGHTTHTGTHTHTGNNTISTPTCTHRNKLESNPLHRVLENQNAMQLHYIRLQEVGEGGSIEQR